MLYSEAYPMEATAIITVVIHLFISVWMFWRILVFGLSDLGLGIFLRKKESKKTFTILLCKIKIILNLFQ